MEKQAPFAIVPYEVALDERLGRAHLRVLIALLSFRARNTDTIWPSREALSRRCGYSKAKISTVTSQLVEFGWLEKSGVGGRSKSTRYKVTVPDRFASGDLFQRVPDAETVSDGETVSAGRTKRVPAGGTRMEQTKNRPLVAAAPRQAKRDAIFEAVMDACGIDWKTAKPTPSERGAWNKAVKEIRATGADEDEIKRRANAYRRIWPNVSITPMALARHWSECMASPQSIRREKPVEVDEFAHKLAHANRAAGYIGMTRNGETDEEWVEKVNDEFSKRGQSRNRRATENRSAGG